MPQTSEPEIDTIEMTHGWIKAGALMMLLAVVLTIFGPKGISPFIDSQYRDNATQTTAESAPAGSELVVGRAKIMMDRFERATLCQLTHGLAIIAIGILLSLRRRRMLLIALWSFLAGTVFYSGCLFANIATGDAWFETASLVGAVVILAGWLAVVEGACQDCKR